MYLIFRCSMSKCRKAARESVKERERETCIEMKMRTFERGSIRESLILNILNAIYKAVAGRIIQSTQYVVCMTFLFVHSYISTKAHNTILCVCMLLGERLNVSVTYLRSFFLKDPTSVRQKKRLI